MQSYRFKFKNIGQIFIILIAILCLYNIPSWIFENEISEYSPTETAAALAKLRNSVADVLYQDYMNEDYYLMRWLAAKRLDVNQAAEMIRKAHTWRISNKIDSILTEPIIEKLTFRSDGFDLEGHPIAEVEAGNWDLRTIAEAGEGHVFNRNLNRIFEGLIKRARNSEKANITTGVLVFNLAGYDPELHACVACIPAQLKVITDIESYYPNTLRRIFMINVPPTFETLLQLMRPLMSDFTRRILRPYGLDKAEWQNALFKEISQDQLSLNFGGVRV